MVLLHPDSGAIKGRKRGNKVYLEGWKSTRRNGKVVSIFVRYV